MQESGEHVAERMMMEAGQNVRSIDRLNISSLDVDLAALRVSGN